MQVLRWALPVVVLLAVAGATGLLWRDAQAADQHLRVAADALGEARTAFSDGDVDGGLTHVSAARAAVADASGRTDGVLWAGVAAVPRYGVNARAARGTVELAEAATEVAAVLGERADGLLEQGAAAFVGEDGQVRTTELREVAEQLDGLGLDELQAARDRLAGLPSTGMVDRLAAGRARAVALADEALTTLRRADQGLEALAGFLGGEGDRTYLLGVQNPGELRGTGGLLSYLAELRVEDGRLSVQAAGVEASDDPEDLIARGRDTGNTLSNLDPVPRPAAFADRYDHIAGGAILQSVNADPDLPTVAPVLVDLYEERSGRSGIDGVVLVDPLFLAEILPVTGGALEVDPALLEGVEGMPTTLTEDTIAEALTVTVYDSFGGTNEARRVFDEAITLQVLERLTSGQWDPVALTRALADAAAERHLQLWSSNEDEQAAFVDLGLAGAMPNEERGWSGDVLALTGINAAANKQDTLVAHRINGAIALGAVRESAPPTAMRTGTLQVELENPVTPDRDGYLSGATSTGPDGEQTREASGLNRTWFSLWTRPTTEVRELREGGQAQAFRATNIHGHRVFDHFLETASQTTNGFEMDLEGRVELARDDEGMTYDLVLWRQAKAIPDHWDLTIAPPPGWSVESASVEGGGEPTGMGVGGSGGSTLSASVEDGEVRVVGAVTRDATVRVELGRG